MSNFSKVYGQEREFDTRWFWRLKSSNDPTNKSKALLDVNDESSLEGKVVLRQVVSKKNDSSLDNGGVSMRYTVVKDHIRAWQLMMSFHLLSRTFHEVVIEGSLQKPRCDIDVDFNTFERCNGRKAIDSEELHSFGLEAFNHIVKSFIVVMNGLGCDVDLTTNVIVLDSTRHDKFSRHVTFDGFVHRTHLEAKQLYHLVSQDIDTLYLQCIDPSVYGANQCLRIMGSVKEGTNIPLMFLDSFTIDEEVIEHKYPVKFANDQHKQIVQMSLSLLTSCIDCKHIKGLAVEKKVYKSINSVTINEEIAKEALSLLDDEKSFTIDTVESSMIKLRRVAPSMCSICCRIHDSTSPFLLVSQEGNVRYMCRRDLSSHCLIGKVYVEHTDEVIETLLKEKNEDEDKPTPTPIPAQNKNTKFDALSKECEVHKSLYKGKKKISNKIKWTNDLLKLYQSGLTIDPLDAL